MIGVPEQHTLAHVAPLLRSAANDVEREPGSTTGTSDAKAAPAEADAPEAETEPKLDTSHHDAVVTTDPDNEGMDHKDVAWEEEEDDYVPEIAASETRPASTAKSS